MEKITVTYTNDPAVPAVLRVGETETKVWSQQHWTEGIFARYIQHNGCGHCCCAMAANLHGVAITPHTEYELCRSLWGDPKPPQGHYQSVSGIVKILHHFGVPAQCFGVTEDAPRQISDALRQNGQVIFWSHPSKSFPENPFSKNEHYVLAVGMMEEASILIANSSFAAAPGGVQQVQLSDISRALFLNAQPQDTTWGEDDNFPGCAGYVIVG